MVYINGIGSVSIQNEGQMELPDISQSSYVRCQDPDFSQYIPPIASRRMSKIIKRAIVSSKRALADAEMECPQAIISGTGLGCIEDTEKFLSAMIKDKETFLQPTHFIQSTHNTISSQIAMYLKCYGYNNTYSHLGISFESALLDAFLQLQTRSCENVLVGGYDEMTPNYHFMLSKLKFWDNCFSGEGCTSFLIANQQTERSYCKIDDIRLFYNPKSSSDVVEEINTILQDNGWSFSDFGAIMWGMSGNPANDSIYHSIYDNHAELSLKQAFMFKKYSGEYFTASAFGINRAANLLKEPNNSVNKILFHQHFHNQAHALILLSTC